MTGVPSNRELIIAKIACAYGGLAWGLFWLPLRALEGAGIVGVTATAVFYAVPLLFVSPLFILRIRHFGATDQAFHVAALLTAVSMVFYAMAFLYTDVVRAMLLYYMTPIWSALLARLWLKEAITPARMVSFVLGFAGLLVIFGIDTGVPLPKNIGDWMSLAAGVIWAVAVVIMRRGIKGEAVELTLFYLLYGSLFAVALVLFSGEAGQSPMRVHVLLFDMAWMLPAIIVLVVPTVFAVMWGSPKLNPGTVGILFMTEISVGSVTAWLWSGDPFGARELAGVILITSAGLAETVGEMASSVGRRLAGRV